jgi:hypothetical protein
MSYLEELLPEFRKGAKIRCKYWAPYIFIQNIDDDDIDIKDLHRDDWEFYQEPIDWDYVIKNKCLCWFWDDNLNYVMCLGYLTRLMNDCPNNEGFIYCKDNGVAFKNCRPVRKDEVNFYEDKKDEQD